LSNVSVLTQLLISDFLIHAFTIHILGQMPTLISVKEA
jgi:hypothetical protein